MAQGGCGCCIPGGIQGQAPKEAVDAASLEAFKARLDVARGILV